MRKFIKTEFKLVVLAEGQSLAGTMVSDLNLEQLHHEITEGSCSGIFELISEDEVSGPEMARLLIEQGSDPEFFQLSPEGVDLIDDDEDEEDDDFDDDDDFFDDDDDFEDEEDDDAEPEPAVPPVA